MKIKTDSLKSRLIAKQKAIMREAESEAERISKLISAISDAEKYLGQSDKGDIQQKLPLPITSKRKKIQEKSGRQRIIEAIRKMPDTFTSKELWNCANEDGQGPEIKASTFQPYMTKLIKNGIVISIQKHTGTTPGIYKKGVLREAQLVG